MPKVVSQQIQPIGINIPISNINLDTQSLITCERVVIRDKIIIIQDKEIRLLRIEIDNLKKKIKTNEVIKGIDRLQNDLDKIKE